jgi:hypothetical protein
MIQKCSQHTRQQELPSFPSIQPVGGAHNTSAWSKIVTAKNRSFIRDVLNRVITVGDNEYKIHDRKGHRYLSVLLSHPYHSIAAVDLKAMDDGRDPREFHRSAIQVMTTDDLQEIRKRCEQLREDLADAKEAGHYARHEKILSELTCLVDIYKKNVDRRGRPRVKRLEDRIRQAVNLAIKRSLWSVSQVAPELKTYFNQTVETGQFLYYRPIANETWCVD